MYCSFIVVGGRTIAHQRTLENSRIKSANGVSLAKGKRGSSTIAARNGNASARFAANAIRGINSNSQCMLNNTMSYIIL